MSWSTIAHEESETMYADRVLQISFAVVLAAGYRVEAEGQNTASAELRITIYDEARVPQKELLDALDGLRHVLQKAKIRSRAALGDLDAAEASLFMHVETPRNGAKAPPSCGARRDIALKIIGTSPRSLPWSVLGMSSPFADVGLNVCIFNDHVREAAGWHDKPYPTVLSFAMAHEIGHVLLRSGAHTSWGIMARLWTGFEYEEMARRSLLFDDDEAKAIEANVSGPPCPASPPASGFRERPRSDEGTAGPTFPRLAVRDAATKDRRAATRVAAIFQAALFDAGEQGRPEALRLHPQSLDGRRHRTRRYERWNPHVRQRRASVEAADTT
jgi:hypothetical protein